MCQEVNKTDWLLGEPHNSARVPWLGRQSMSACRGNPDKLKEEIQIGKGKLP